MTWGQPQVDDSTLTDYLKNPEAMIQNEQSRNNYPDPESFTEHWQLGGKSRRFH